MPLGHLKVKHLFVGLMGISAITAFFIPARFVEGRVHIDIFFAPVARPAGAMASLAQRRWHPEQNTDTRSDDVVRRENVSLKNEVANLRVQIEDLKRIAEDHARYGDIRALCTPYAVIGSDTGARSTLAIQGSSLQGLRDGMVALYPDGIVGRVQGAGIGGTRIQLVTDLAFRVRVGFARFEGAKFFRVGKVQTLAEGSGRGAMLIRGLTKENVKDAGLLVGDWVILNEPDWPPYLQGRVLGRITSIGARPDAPLFAQIVVEPAQNLMRLNEVMIVTKDPGERMKEKG